MFDWSLSQFDVDGALDTEGFGDDMSTGRTARFFFCEEPLEDFFSHPGMVYGESVNGPVSNEIEPAVSDMGNASTSSYSNTATTVVPIPA